MYIFFLVEEMVHNTRQLTLIGSKGSNKVTAEHRNSSQTPSNQPKTQEPKATKNKAANNLQHLKKTAKAWSKRNKTLAEQQAAKL